MRRLAIGTALALALMTPVSASAATIFVDGPVLRYAGDDGNDSLVIDAVRNGELILDTGADPGPGCRARDYSSSSEVGFGNRACAMDGVTSFEVTTAAGNDVIDQPYGFGRIPVPMRVDMGPGDDKVDWATTFDDDITLGEGNDLYSDAPGNDHVDAGPGNDDVYGGDIVSTGDDVVLGGEGDDNLDPRAGNDIVDGGPGNDLIHSSLGDDVMDGGPGDDNIGGRPTPEGPNTCETSSGNDTLLGGDGSDGICAVEDTAVVDGGAGDDAISTLDAAPDGPIACGAGTDSLWSDAVDAVGVDCEFQSQPELVTIPIDIPGVLPVHVPCTPGTCTGTVTAFSTPHAPTPKPGALPPLRPSKPSTKPLAKQRFKLRRRSSRTLRVKLNRRAARRLRKLGKTRVEARIEFIQKGRRYVVRRSFAVGPRKR